MNCTIICQYNLKKETKCNKRFSIKLKGKENQSSPIEKQIFDQIFISNK